jgi:hypothetical protein
MFKILAKLQKIFYSAKKLRHKMSFLLKNHSLVAKSAAKVVPKGCERRLRATLISNKVVEDVVGFGDGEFLTDLSLTLVNSLKTLTSEHVNLLCRKICLK